MAFNCTRASHMCENRTLPFSSMTWRPKAQPVGLLLPREGHGQQGATEVECGRDHSGEEDLARVPDPKKGVSPGMSILPT